MTARTLLLTTTGDPFQPIRLYYSVPNRAAVTRAFQELRCMREAEGKWLWHFDEEASSLMLPGPRAEVPEALQPIMLGRFRWPEHDKIVLEVRSTTRAIAAANFFAPRFGPRVLLQRVRVLNRFLDASEAARGLDRIDKLLDQNVVKIDPEKTLADIEAVVGKSGTRAEKLTAYLADAEARRKKDVPLVEDFPLAPEEETDDFLHLTGTLQFRAIRAYEHWKGNTHLTLADIIHMVIEDGGRGLSVGATR